MNAEPVALSTERPLRRYSDLLAGVPALPALPRVCVWCLGPIADTTNTIETIDGLRHFVCPKP